MDFIRHSKHTKFIIFSDSKSSLEALNGFKIELYLVLKIVKDYTYLIKAGKVVEFCWISSHVNIPGNETADTAAKAALCLPVTCMKLPASELKPCTSRFCLEEWQDIWNSATNNKLYAIYPTVRKCVHNNLISRRDAVIVNRLTIGHFCLTHSYLLSGEDQPLCTKCDTVLTVKRILLDCPDLRDVRLKYFTASSLKDIFESVDNQNIIGFVEDAQFYFTARRSYASAVLGVVILSVRPSVRPSVRLCLSHACFVTNPKNLPAIFVYHMKGQYF